jgi:hypothetical protein
LAPLPPVQDFIMSVCSICHDEVNSSTGKIVTSCNHEFHVSCLSKWMQKENATCPECRCVPGPKEVYTHVEVQEEDEDDDEDDDEDEEQSVSLTHCSACFRRVCYSHNTLLNTPLNTLLLYYHFTQTNPLVTVMKKQSQAAIAWMMDNETPFVNPGFKQEFDEILKTCDIEELVPWGSKMVTPLCFAVQAKGCEEAVASLLAAGARVKSLAVFWACNCCVDDTEEEQTLENALFGACLVNSTECVKAVLAAGADIQNFVNTKDFQGCTPLMRCLDTNDVNFWRMDLVKVLLEAGASVGTRDTAGMNVFHKTMTNRTCFLKSDDGFSHNDLHDVLLAAYVKEMGN